MKEKCHVVIRSFNVRSQIPSGEAPMPRQSYIGAWQAVIKHKPINWQTQSAGMVTQKTNYNQSGNTLQQCLDRYLHQVCLG
jgi:hypothetical protein